MDNDTATLIARAQAALEGTTPGPWHWNVQGFVGPVSTDDDQSFGMICDEVAEVTFSGGCKEANARLIASAPTLIADMAAALTAQAAEIARLTEAHEAMMKINSGACCALDQRNRDLDAALARGAVLRLSISRKIGMYGGAFDGPFDARAYTYAHPPGNQHAWAIGKAASQSAKDRAGDYIDSGLSLLRHLNTEGLGVFALNENDDLVPETHEGGAE